MTGFNAFFNAFITVLVICLALPPAQPSSSYVTALNLVLAACIVSLVWLRGPK